MAYVYNTSITTTNGDSITDMVMSPDGSKIYVVAAFPFASASDTFLVIDTGTLTQVAALDLFTAGGFRGASGVAISPDGATAYVACQTTSHVVAVDTASVTVSDSLSGISLAGDVCVSPDGTTVWAVRRAGSLGVIYKIQAAGLNLLSQLQYPFRWPPIVGSPTDFDTVGFENVLISNDGDAVYASEWLSVGDFGAVSKVDATSTVPVMLGTARGWGERDFGIARNCIEISPDDSTLYVIQEGQQTPFPPLGGSNACVITIPVATLQPASSVDIGADALGAEISNDGSLLFCSADGVADTGLLTYDTATDTASAIYPSPGGWTVGSVVAFSDKSRVFVARTNLPRVGVWDEV